VRGLLAAAAGVAWPQLTTERNVVIAFSEENWKGPFLCLAVSAIPVVGITYHAFTTEQGGSLSAIVVSDEFGLVKQGKGVGVKREYIVSSQMVLKVKCYL